MMQERMPVPARIEKFTNAASVVEMGDGGAESHAKGELGDGSSGSI